MLSESSRFATIEKLKALAEHPNTSPEEAENARRRIEQIRERIDEERTQVRKATPIGDLASGAFPNIRRKGLDHLRRKRRAIPLDVEPERTMKDEWPFGWTGPRQPIEYESMRNPTTYDLVVGWKCPGCGEHVTRIIDKRAVLRAEGQRGGVKGFIKKLTGGSVNQLCWDCWKLWNNK